MSLVAARVRIVAQRLRDQGYTVVEIPGWETRGKGEMAGVRGMVCHHTASNRRAGNAPALRLVTHGRRDLQNSLSMWVVGRDGTIFLVAAGVSWHAGKSAWQGDSYLNRTYSGIEAENDGLGEPWPAASLAAQLAICVEMGREFRFTPFKVAEHREVAIPSGRKTDRKNIAGPDWRARVAHALRTGTTPEPPEEDVMTPAQERKLDEVLAGQKRHEEWLRKAGLMKADGTPTRKLGDDAVLIRRGVRALAKKAGLKTKHAAPDQVDA